MKPFVSRPGVQQLRRSSFIKWIKVIGPALLLIALMSVNGLWGIVYASQSQPGDTTILAQQGGGIKGYVVGSGGVSAYACPDVNPAKCPIRLTLTPGTQVVILDNVVGSFVPALNDNAWRKILVQGQTLYVPQRYISLTPASNPANNVADISFVQTGGEDDSISVPPASNFTTAPVSKAQAAVGVPGAFQCLGSFPVLFNDVCCPPNSTINGTDCVSTAGQDIHTWYVASDGRMNGGPGDRIAVYCRRTGRIEVWSINLSQGHFIVSFNHLAVDAARNAGLTANAGAQGIVTIAGNGHGMYWAAIHGGPYNATGVGDFSKTFQCYMVS